MKSLIAALAFVLALATPAIQAQTTNDQVISDITTALLLLTPEAKATVVKNLETKPSAPVVPQQSKLDQVANLGKSIGIGIGEAAKGVGMAASDFFETPAGILVAVIIAVKLLGPFFVGVLFMFIYTGVAIGVIRMMRRGMAGGSVEYDETKTNIFGNYPKKRVKYGELSSEASFGLTVLSLILCGGLVLCAAAL